MYFLFWPVPIRPVKWLAPKPPGLVLDYALNSALAALERKIGQAHYRRGDHALAEERLIQALTYLDDPLPASRWAVRRGIVGEVIRQVLIRLAPGLMSKSRNGHDFANEIGQLYEQAMIYLEIGRRQGELDLLKQANAILAEIRERPDLPAVD